MVEAVGDLEPIAVQKQAGAEAAEVLEKLVQMEALKAPQVMVAIQMYKAQRRVIH
jgi:hypothetical protein